MRFHVRFTEEARADLLRLYVFALRRDEGHLASAERALETIERGIALLETSPFACRRTTEAPFLRELVIGFGATGYVALFEIEDARTVTVLAVRHQRESDYQ